MNHLVRSCIEPHPKDHHVVGLIGADIGPSLSPAAPRARGRELGVRYSYERIDIDELEFEPIDVGELLAEARRMGFRGLNITYPCKQSVLGYLDELSDEAEALGAVNTVVFSAGKMVGYNTDGLGFRGASRTACPDVAANSVVLDRRRRRWRRGRTRGSVPGRRAARDLRPPSAERARELAKSLSRRFGPGASRRSTGWHAESSRVPTGSSTPRRPGWPSTPACRSRSRCMRPRLVGGGRRLPAARDRAAAPRAPAGLPNARRRRHGGDPGRPVFRAVHWNTARPGADAPTFCLHRRRRGQRRRRAG